MIVVGYSRAAARELGESAARRESCASDGDVTGAAYENNTGAKFCSNFSIACTDPTPTLPGVTHSDTRRGIQGTVGNDCCYRYSELYRSARMQSVK